MEEGVGEEPVDPRLTIRYIWPDYGLAFSARSMAN